jgi:MFS family permease
MLLRRLFFERIRQYMASNASENSHPILSQVGRPSWLINRNFGLLVIGQGISQFGDVVFNFMLAVWIVATVAAGQSWAPLAFGATILAGYLPALVIGPWAGVFVDRWQHRRTLIIMDILRACFIALMILFTGALPLPWHFSPFVTISLVCVINLLESTCGQFFNPAISGLIGQIVPQQQQPEAEGLSLALNSTAKLLGPILGPVLYFSVGIFWCLLINVISFLISVITIRAIQAIHIERPATEQQQFWHDFSQGLRFSFQERVIRVLIIAIFIVTLGMGAVDALFIFFIQRNLHTDLSLSGILVSAIGLGSIVGALVLGKLATKIGLVRLLYTSLLGLGLSLLLYSRLTNFPLAVFVAFLVGMIVVGVNIAIGPLLLQETPPELIGRVGSILNTFGMLGNILSVLLAGWLASVVLASLHVQAFGTVFGPIDTIFLGAGCFAFLGGLYAFVALRKVTLKTVLIAEKAQEVAIQKLERV